MSMSLFCVNYALIFIIVLNFDNCTLIAYVVLIPDISRCCLLLYLCTVGYFDCMSHDDCSICTLRFWCCFFSMYPHACLSGCNIWAPEPWGMCYEYLLVRFLFKLGIILIFFFLIFCLGSLAQPFPDWLWDGDRVSRQIRILIPPLSLLGKAPVVTQPPGLVVSWILLSGTIATYLHTPEMQEQHWPFHQSDWVIADWHHQLKGETIPVKAL